MSIRNRFFDCLEWAGDFLFEKVLGIHDMEDTSDMEEYLREVDLRSSKEPVDTHYPTLSEDVQKAMREVKAMRQDKDVPNLFVGKFIKDSAITCEVVACTPDDFRVIILKIEWDRLGTYLDVGQTYPLRVVYESGNGNMTVWEIPPEHMKRDTSQVLLAWEKGIGWTWDLDM